jgi:polysaccharide export outer membrane protein
MKLIALLLVLLSCSLSRICAAEAEEPAEETLDRKIAPSDTIIIEVFGEKDLTVERRVQQTGTILYPLLQTVEVAGKTPGEIAAFLQEALGKDYLVDPQVSVTVKEYASRTVNVTGEVMKGGAFILPGELKWTIVDAIAAAGGFTRNANKGKIEFTRNGKTKKFSWEDLKNQKKPVYLEPGDLIVVGESLF